MATRTILLTSLRILAVCLLFAVCFIVGGALSGIDKAAQQTVSSQPANQQVPQMPEDFLRSFLIFTLCAGGTLSYVILRSRWHGWTLVAALFAPLAVLALGKWRATSIRPPMSPAVPPKPASLLLRVAILAAAFVFLYMFFGYYVAWRNPELRRFYGGPEETTFWAAWQHNWTSSPWIYALAVFRALLHVGCLYPLVRMLHASRRESALAAALFLTCWTTVLLLPNPLMPASVARSHFWETLGFNLVFGALAGWLLCFTESAEPAAAIGPKQPK